MKCGLFVFSEFMGFSYQSKMSNCKSTWINESEAYFIVRIKKDEGDHHEVVGSPTDDKGQNDNEGNSQGFSFSSSEDGLSAW